MDPFDLDRFVTAQASTYDDALGELRAGRKRSHWMWFIFPQLCGLGHSAMAQAYGIASLDEARAYLAHPLLGPRLREITQAVIDSPAPSLDALFGSPDGMKFCSSMTLFAQVTTQPFSTALDQWCEGPDRRTLAMLDNAG